MRTVEEHQVKGYNSRKKWGIIMKKLLYSILSIIIGVALFLVYLRMDDGKDSVTFKTETKHGITFDIPEGYKESYSTLDSTYIYESKKDPFRVTVSSTLLGYEVTMEEYLAMFYELLTTGSTSNEYGTYSRSSNAYSNLMVLSNDVENINGIDMGKLAISYSSEQKGKKYYLKENMYIIMHNNQLILVNFTFERKNEDKHRETIDHIVNSIKL